MGNLEAYLPLVLIVVVGYLLLIRPARKRAQRATELQRAISPGDEVMLSSGLFGTIVNVVEDVAHVELAPGLVVRVLRGAIAKIIVDQQPSYSADDQQEPGETSGDSDAGVS